MGVEYRFNINLKSQGRATWITPMKELGYSDTEIDNLISFDTLFFFIPDLEPDNIYLFSSYVNVGPSFSTRRTLQRIKFPSRLANSAGSLVVVKGDRFASIGKRIQFVGARSWTGVYDIILQYNIVIKKEFADFNNNVIAQRLTDYANKVQNFTSVDSELDHLWSQLINAPANIDLSFGQSLVENELQIDFNHNDNVITAEYDIDDNEFDFTTYEVEFI